VFCTSTTFAKHSHDVVVLKNGDRLTGEIKGLQRGELKIKADYIAEAVCHSLAVSPALASTIPHR